MTLLYCMCNILFLFYVIVLNRYELPKQLAMCSVLDILTPLFLMGLVPRTISFHRVLIFISVLLFILFSMSTFVLLIEMHYFL